MAGGEGGLQRRVHPRQALDRRVHREERGQERDERAGGQVVVADRPAAVEEGADEREAADALHQGGQDGGRPRDPHVDAEEARRGAAEPRDLEALHAEGLHHAEARDRLLEDLGDVLPAAQGGLVRRAQALAEAEKGAERERHAEEGEDGELPVRVEEHDEVADDREAFLEQVAGQLRDRGLDLLDVGGDVAHQRAGRAAAEEGERLVEDVLVEGVAQVGDGVLPGVGDERRREVRADALRDVEQEDGQRQDADVLTQGQGLVEYRLDLVDDERPGGRVAGGGQPGQEQPPPVRPGEHEQPTEELELGAEALGHPAPALARAAPAAPGCERFLSHALSKEGSVQRDALISLSGRHLSAARKGKCKPSGCQ